MSNNTQPPSAISGEALLSSYFAQFPDDYWKHDYQSLACHFDTVARDFMKKAEQCLEASGLLRSGSPILPTPVKNAAVDAKTIRRLNALPCTAITSTVLGVPTENKLPVERSALLYIRPPRGNNLKLILYDPESGEKTMFVLCPGSKANGKLFAELFSQLANNLEVIGDRADYMKKVPATKICRLCGEARVRPLYGSPTNHEDIHRDHLHCMACKAAITQAIQEFRPSVMLWNGRTVEAANYLPVTRKARRPGRVITTRLKRRRTPAETTHG